jgi:hypothetical protein
MLNTASEILINARQVTRTDSGDAYEFILNENLQVLECVKIESLARGIIRPIYEIKSSLQGMLFELNHVRVNPRLDNTEIIRNLTDALNEIGVQVSNPPPKDTVAVCFKPLGEISDSVRFYLNKNEELIFLSPSMRPKVICSNKLN